MEMLTVPDFMSNTTIEHLERERERDRPAHNTIAACGGTNLEGNNFIGYSFI
jgi:hypothetical protein